MAALAFTVGSLIVPSSTLPAQADEPGVAVSIASVSPHVWEAGGQLVITGSVTNSTKSDISGAHVTFWQSDTALTTLTDLDAALANPDVTSPVGTTSQGGVTLGSNGLLSAGASVAFTVKGTPSLPRSGAAYLVGVQVLDNAGNVLGRARLALGVASASQFGAVVVPLTARPSLINPEVTGDVPSQAVFEDESLLTLLRGQLGRALSLAEQPGVTALIDPILVDDLKAMADGYQVQSDPTAEPKPGLGQTEAATALLRIQALIDRGDAYRLPANSPDLNEVAATPQAAAIAAAAVQINPDHPLAGLGLAVFADGALTDDAQKLLVAMAPSLIISNSLQPGATTARDSSNLLWVGATPVDVLAKIDGPGPNPGAVQQISARLARLIVAAGGGTPTVVVADSPTAVESVSSWMATGWRPLPLAQVVNQLLPGNLAWANDPASVTLPDDLASSVARVGRQLTLWDNLSDSGDDCTATAHRLLPGVFASSWQGDWIAASDWLAAAGAQLDQLVGTGSVTLRIANEWHLSSNNNRLPITIVNTMGIPVQVRVHFISENPGRLSVPDSEVMTVEAGSTTTVNVMPKAAGNGSVQVTARLLSASGTVIGAPVHVQVVTTSAGRLAWIIIIGAGVAFVIATSLRVRQVRHQRRLDQTDHTDPLDAA